MIKRNVPFIRYCIHWNIRLIRGPRNDLPTASRDQFQLHLWSSCIRSGAALTQMNDRIAALSRAKARALEQIEIRGSISMKKALYGSTALVAASLFVGAAD